MSWLKACATIEHTTSYRDTAGIPLTDILVESTAHRTSAHIGDIAGIPSADILIESVAYRTSLISVTLLVSQPPISWLKAQHLEHLTHIGDIAGIPTADVLVEIHCIFEHACSYQ